MVRSLLQRSFKMLSSATSRSSSSSRIVDLRSDTVTRPTVQMRKRMAEAVVGDDVYGDDPTVHELEARVASITGMESGLFMTTGTLSNLIAVLTWCTRRDAEVILGDKCHIHIYEQGGVSQFGGVATHLIPTEPNGTLCVTAIGKAVRADNIHFPVTQLICLENTHNLCGGRALSAAYTDSVGKVAKEHNLPVHLDGARIWNAATALGCSVSDLTRSVQSVSVCFSKGLGAPVGTVLAGPKSFIASARRLRKALGGGMRQSGVLAAAALQSLDDFEAGFMNADHQRAKWLATELCRGSDLTVDLDTVETNMFEVAIPDSRPFSSTHFADSLREKGVLLLPRNMRTFRVVLHRDIDDEAVQHCAKAMISTVHSLSRQ